MSSKKLVKKMHSGYEFKQAVNYIGKFFCSFWRLYTVFTRVRMDHKWVYVRMGEVGRGWIRLWAIGNGKTEAKPIAYCLVPIA
jgi:hypothetical protein